MANTEYIHPKQIHITCTCGCEVELELLGGQYQDTWKGKCVCGRFWVLEEIAEEIEEKDEIDETA